MKLYLHLPRCCLLVSAPGSEYKYQGRKIQYFYDTKSYNLETKRLNTTWNKDAQYAMVRHSCAVDHSWWEQLRQLSDSSRRILRYLEAMHHKRVICSQTIYISVAVQQHPPIQPFCMQVLVIYLLSASTYTARRLDVLSPVATPYAAPHIPRPTIHAVASAHLPLPLPPPPSLATTYTIPAAYSGAYTPPTYLTNPYLFTPAVVSVCARDAAPVAYTPAAIPAVGFSAHSRPATPQQKSNTIDLSDIALRAFYFEGICGKGVVTPMSSTVLQ